MEVKHYILIKKKEKIIGSLVKKINMPCLPPIGTLVFFGDKAQGFPQRVKEISYSEESQIFRAHYEIDIFEEQIRLKDFISDSFIPVLFVTKFGFELEWVNEEFEAAL